MALPDPRKGLAPLPQQLRAAVAELDSLLLSGPVYLHCVAGMERSPLVAMAWLMQHRRMDLHAALVYLSEVHPASRPQVDQLAALQACGFGAQAV
nr:dual specificity protein phosphatase family protein [Synechococcus sp. CS-1328]